jgi:hypothetical protein
MAVLTGVFVAVKLFNRKGYSIKLLGDGKTALKWSKNEQYRGSRVRRSSIAYTIIGSMFDLEVVETVHVPGVDNVLCDRLSRNHDIPFEEKLVGTGMLNIPEDLIPRVTGLLELCNPNLPLGSMDEFKTCTFSLTKNSDPGSNR